MGFLWPAMLWLVLLLPLIFWQYRRVLRQRQARAATYGSLGLIQAAGGAQLGRRRYVPPALYMLGLASLVLALARPTATVSIPRVQGTLILAFDVSGSMAAEDFQPTRMEAAKVAARQLVEQQPIGVQIGVVAFSDSGFAIQPPTDDQGTVLLAIERISPQRGTSLGQGILAALNTLVADETQQPRRYTTLPEDQNTTPLDTPAAIVLFTDGENTAPPEPMEAAILAAQRNVHIHTVGIGSPEGIDLHINGFTVHTQLDEATLQQIAEATQGSYFNARDQTELQSVYDSIDLRFQVVPEPIEITALLAGFALFAILLGVVFSMIWLGRVP